MRVRINRKGPVFAPLGDSALVVTLGMSPDQETLERARSLASALEPALRPAVLDTFSAYGSVAVFYDPAQVAPGEGSPYERMCRAIEPHCPREPLVSERRLRRKPPPGFQLEVPVCYGGEFGPDLGAVAAACGLPAAEVIALHSAPEYLVQAIGFSPGFPYLTGLPEKLHTPRKTTPRERVPAGSVGIGGAQTGVYPIETPGGWNLIGRTPLRLFCTNNAPPALLQTGDRVRFKRITPEEFAAWK
jgi:inhibitor of KinA